MKFIDLSVLLTSDTPVYPGDSSVEITRQAILATDGYTQHDIKLSTHVGTHIDAPLHMVEGGQTLESFSVGNTIGPGIVFDVREGWNTDLILRHTLKPASIVLFYTGWISKYSQPGYYEQYEALPEAIARWLIKQKAHAVGFDMSGPDYPPFAIHKLLLGNGILIIENLTNLGQLPEDGFRVIGLPLRVDLDGSPIRVIAELPS